MRKALVTYLTYGEPQAYIVNTASRSGAEDFVIPWHPGGEHVRARVKRTQTTLKRLKGRIVVAGSVLCDTCGCTVSNATRRALLFYLVMADAIDSDGRNIDGAAVKTSEPWCAAGGSKRA